VEHLLEEFIAFNVWLLASDHVNQTKFEYRFEDAVGAVSKTLGLSLRINDQDFAWRPSGGNVLGTLLVYQAIWNVRTILDELHLG
jgi:hypothetical protein